MKAGRMAWAMLCVAALASCKPAETQTPPQPTPPQAPTPIPLWPAGLEIAKPELTGPEETGPVDKLVGGRPWTYVANVSRPTMTVYPPKGRNTGAAMMVFPGGGYHVLPTEGGPVFCDECAERSACVSVRARMSACSMVSFGSRAVLASYCGVAR